MADEKRDDKGQDTPEEKKVAKALKGEAASVQPKKDGLSKIRAKIEKKNQGK